LYPSSQVLHPYSQGLNPSCRCLSPSSSFTSLSRFKPFLPRCKPFLPMFVSFLPSFTSFLPRLTFFFPTSLLSKFKSFLIMSLFFQCLNPSSQYFNGYNFSQASVFDKKLLHCPRIVIPQVSQRTYSVGEVERICSKPKRRIH